MSLIQRLEKLTGPDREVDAAIQNAVFGWHKWATSTPWIAADDNLPTYTASIDAALTLVSDGWDYTLSGPSGKNRLQRYYARVSNDGLEHEPFFVADVCPSNQAIALCIAALKARGIK